MSSQITNKIKSDKLIQQIKTFAKNTKVLLVGGVIRDFCLGKENHDKDIIVVEKTLKSSLKSLQKNLMQHIFHLMKLTTFTGLF